jgi:hypothetical protein
MLSGFVVSAFHFELELLLRRGVRRWLSASDVQPVVILHNFTGLP